VARIRAVLFDFGGTLFDYADLAAAQLESLVELGRKLDLAAPPEELGRAHREALSGVFRSYLARPYYLHRDMFTDAIRKTTQILGRDVNDDDLEHYFREQHRTRARDFRLRAGVEDTLAALAGRDLHIGMVSNIDEADLQHLVDLAGLRDRFASLLSSESAGSCKPDRKIFELALERAGCEPGEALFVGDTLEQDVLGANRCGMQSVLLWHRDDRPPPEHGPQPRHVIRAIPELVKLVG
jgi:putative hydrolase of the HAD superfamily